MRTRYQSLLAATQQVLGIDQQEAEQIVAGTRVGKLAKANDLRILEESLSNNMEELFDELKHTRKYKEQALKTPVERIILAAQTIVEKNYEESRAADKRVIANGYRKKAVSDVEIKNYYNKIQKRSVRNSLRKNNITNRTKGAL